MHRLATLPSAGSPLVAYLLAVVCLPSLAPLCRDGVRAACPMPAKGAAKGCCCKRMGHGEARETCALHARHDRCSFDSRPVEAPQSANPALAFDGRGIHPVMVGLAAPRPGARRPAAPVLLYQPPSSEVPTPPPRLAA